MVQITIGGFKFGIVPNHWWDNQTPFDDFTGVDGAAPDTSKWDTATVVPSNSTAAVDIQSNNCRIYTLMGNISGTLTATLTLKTAITQGKLLALIESITTNEANNGTGSFVIQVGNATDGYTTVATASGGDTAFPAQLIEAVYAGINNWNIYISGVAYASNPITLVNGLKLKIQASANGDQLAYCDIRVKEVYVKN